MTDGVFKSKSERNKQKAYAKKRLKPLLPGLAFKICPLVLHPHPLVRAIGQEE